MVIIRKLDLHRNLRFFREANVYLACLFDVKKESERISVLAHVHTFRMIVSVSEMEHYVKIL